MGTAEKLFALFFTLVVVGLWFVLIYWTIRSLLQWRRDRRQPVETVVASISRLYEEEEYIYAFGESTIASHIAVFQSEDGREFRFSLTPPTFRSLFEGDRGRLTMRDGGFVSFESLTNTGQMIHASGSDHEKVYRRIVRGK